MSAPGDVPRVTRENWREVVEHLADREAAASDRERARVIAEIREALAAAGMDAGPDAMLECLRERLGEAAVASDPDPSPITTARTEWFEASNIASGPSSLLLDSRQLVTAEGDHRLPDVLAHYAGAVERMAAAGYSLAEVLEDRVADVERRAAART